MHDPLPPLLHAHIAPPEAPLAHVPGSVYFWWAFFALGVVAFAAGLWGMVLRRLRRRRLQAELALWPEHAPAAGQAQWLLELVRRHHLQPSAGWLQALEAWRTGDPNPQQPADQASDLDSANGAATLPTLAALRDEVRAMPYLD